MSQTSSNHPTPAAIRERAAELAAAGNPAAAGLYAIADEIETAILAAGHPELWHLAAGAEFAAGLEACPGCDAWRVIGGACEACGYDGAF